MGVNNCTNLVAKASMNLDRYSPMKKSKAYARVKPNWDYFGLIDPEGNYVLEPIFKEIGEWKDGIVLLEKTASKIDVGDEWTNHYNGEYGYFTAEGKMLTDFSFDYARDFYEGMAQVNKNGKWGFIDRSGEIVIECKFEDFGAFHEGECHAKADGKWGWIDLKGDWVLKNEYHSPVNFSYGLAVIEQKEQGSEKTHHRIIDRAGKTVLELPAQWNWYELLSANTLRYGTLPWYPGEGRYGLMNLKGELLTPEKFVADAEQFYHIGEFKEGKIFVETTDESFGYLYESGTFIEEVGYSLPEYVPEPPKTHGVFEEILDFSEGLAVARKGEFWGVVNEAYEEVIAFKFKKRWGRSQGDQGLYFCSDNPKFSCGLLPICEERADNVYAGYMDREGKISIELKFRHIHPFVEVSWGD